MNEISKVKGSVYCNEGAWLKFQEHLALLSPSKIFVLVDENTEVHCLPYFLEKCGDNEFQILKIPAGETHKNIESCMSLWKTISGKGGDRNSLLINLGGGVVTDLGGFVACTYQRGINFINIPTSLLAMVDASVGGKTGIDLGSLKNQVGIIRNPEAVIIDTYFLKSLPQEELRSGLAEVIKHGFISSEKYLQSAFDFNFDQPEENVTLIWESVLIKDRIINQDPMEKGLRKTLNYGHTLGHAIESYFMAHPEEKRLLHGEAIAVGMILETYISSMVYKFPIDKRNTYCKQILTLFPKVNFTEKAILEVMKLLIYDKKNSHGEIRFVLLEAIGDARLDCVVSEEHIKDSFKFYKGLGIE